MSWFLLLSTTLTILVPLAGSRRWKLLYIAPGGRRAVVVEILRVGMIFWKIFIIAS